MNLGETIYKRAKTKNPLVAQLILLIHQRLLQRGVILLLDLFGSNFSKIRKKGWSRTTHPGSFFKMILRGNKNIKEKQKCFNLKPILTSRGLYGITSYFKTFKPRVAL